MRGAATRIVALLLVAFVALGAQCVASCSLESFGQPPCHRTPVKSCAHEQAAGDNLKVVTIELAVIASTVPIAIEPLRIEPLAAPPALLASPPQAAFSTVLRI